MLTPPHELVLVSAVRQPLGHPRFVPPPRRREAAGTDGHEVHWRAGRPRRGAPRGSSCSRQWTEPVRPRRRQRARPRRAPTRRSPTSCLLNQLPAPGDAMVLRTGSRPVGMYRSDEDRDPLHRRVAVHATSSTTRATGMVHIHRPGNDALSRSTSRPTTRATSRARARRSSSTCLHRRARRRRSRSTPSRRSAGSARTTDRRTGEPRATAAGCGSTWPGRGSPPVRTSGSRVVVHDRVLDQRARRELRHFVTAMGSRPRHRQHTARRRSRSCSSRRPWRSQAR